MTKYIELLFEDAAEELPRWLSCKHEDPTVKNLCRDLAYWVSGDMDQVQQSLLGKEAIAKRFCSGHHELYRGYMPDAAQKKSLQQNGWFDIHSDPAAPLASWTTDPLEAIEFMLGFDSFYVVMRKENLDEFCDLVAFDRLAKPFTHMRDQQEVIVHMPPVMRVKQSDIVYRTDDRGFPDKGYNQNFDHGGGDGGLGDDDADYLDDLHESLTEGLLPAVMWRDKVYVGQDNHFDALDQIEDKKERASAMWDDRNRGFVVKPGGRFMNRRQAMTYALKNGLIDDRYVGWAKPGAELPSEWLKPA